MVNIQSGGFVPEAMFEGAYEKKVAEQRAKTAADKYSSSNTSADSKRLQDYIGEGATVTISPESQEFMAGVEERKAAQRAEKAKLLEQYPTNPFAYSGNIFTLHNMETGEQVPKEPTQYLVFSKNLYQNGFYDDMSDEEIKKTEDMLKSITAGVESIYGLTDLERSDSNMSHEAAKLEFMSSINALHYFADKYVPESIRDSFNNLIKEFEKYNSESIEKHKNSDDLYCEAMKNISAPNAVNVSEATRRSQEQTRASQEIGRVTHTKEEETKLKQNYQELFDKLTANKGDARAVFDELQKTLVGFAAGGSKNSTVLNLLNTRNESSIGYMFSYWSKLL